MMSGDVSPHKTAKTKGKSGALRRWGMGAGLVLTTAIALVACETPVTQVPTIGAAEEAAERTEQIDQFFDMRRNTFANHLADLQRVTYAVNTNNTELCHEEVAPFFGFTAWNKYQYAKITRKQRSSAKPTWLGDELKIVDLVEGSPAAEVGLEIGDKIVTLNGIKAPTGQRAHPKFIKMLTSTQGEVRLVIEREGNFRHAVFTPKEGCNYIAYLTEDPQKNAFADGEKILFTMEIMDFFESEQELAVVVGHEIAHNAMSHIDKTRTNIRAGILAGFVLDVAAAAVGVDTQAGFTDMGARMGARAHSQGFEKEADYVGLYMTARAGFDIDGAEYLWRRMAMDNPRSILIATTHPTSPERFLALEKTSVEIATKRSRNEPLYPEGMAHVIRGPGEPTGSVTEANE